LSGEDQKINNDLQNTTQKNKLLETRTSRKPRRYEYDLPFIIRPFWFTFIVSYSCLKGIF